VDGHPVHRSGKVKNWLEEKAEHIRLFFLPGYSPELNPDELLNQDVKSNAVGKKRTHNQKELLPMSAVFSAAGSVNLIGLRNISMGNRSGIRLYKWKLFDAPINK
jgi:hypothetical protein